MDNQEEQGNNFKRKRMENQEEQGNNFILRRLEASDYDKGYMQLLSQLTVCGEISPDKFLERFDELEKTQHTYIFVIEDPNTHRIVVSGTLFVEKKFIRECGSAGHIEDVVVDSSCRGKHLGQKIIEFLTEYAKERGCYKVILDCSVANKVFYEKCGFKEKGFQMAKYFQ